MTITAKYAGTCGRCGGPIEPGSRIEWRKGEPAIHESCPDGTPVEPVAVRTPEYAPTAEQTQALELFATGRDLAIEAGAGTGKTTTLRLLAESTNRRIQYVAFNKAIVVEAGSKMPGNVTCSTAHSLAWRATATEGFKRRMKEGRRMTSPEIADVLSLRDLDVTVDLGEGARPRTLSRSFLAGLAIRGVLRFCQTADLAPTERHVPRVDALDRDANRQIAATLAPVVRAAWADLSRETGRLPFQTSTAMAVFLKLWHLSAPTIAADVILFDECQDANPVMLAVVQAQTHAQRVYVGDSMQQIYTFTGAVNALGRIRETGADVAFLSQSFRFGPAIADVANSILARIPESELRLVGTDSIASVVGPVAEPDAILCRTNATAVRTVLRLQDEGREVALVGGGDDVVRFAKAARDLMEGRRVDHPDLACFASWGEVRLYVEEDEQGGDLRLLVKLVEDFGVDAILRALDRVIREADADVVVSTAHKSKGREWDSVQLSGDFPSGGDDGPPVTDEELRLLYVAATRAKRELDVTAALLLADEEEPGALSGPESPAKPERDPIVPEPLATREEPGESRGEAVPTDPLVASGLSAEFAELLRRVTRPGDRFDLVNRLGEVATVDSLERAVEVAIGDSMRGLSTTVIALHSDGSLDLVYEFDLTSAR